MLIIDKPYISDFLKKTMKDLQVPVLDKGNFFDVKQSKDAQILSEDEFLKIAKKKNPLKLYCNSENSINWISEHLSQTNIPKYIDFCKDKIKFRELLQPLYPNFYFSKVDFKELEKVDTTSIKKPFIVKPSVGFFSIGVVKVTSDEEWSKVVKQLKEEIEKVEGMYPEAVMNSKTFIIEECIEGEEFAIDAYYDELSKPVILNILKHPFSTDTDVSDRIYYTSREIIQEHLETFRRILEQIGFIAGFTNFPVHIEVRMDSKGQVTPIEFNPMRFAGWCVTDIAYYAYGINTYAYYLQGKEPDWDELLQGKEGKVYGFIIVDVPKGLQADQIESFDYDGVLCSFNKVIEFRKIKYQIYPVFAFMFIETTLESNELEKALTMDFTPYITRKKLKRENNGK